MSTSAYDNESFYHNRVSQINESFLGGLLALIAQRPGVGRLAGQGLGKTASTEIETEAVYSFAYLKLVWAV